MDISNVTDKERAIYRRSSKDDERRGKGIPLREHFMLEPEKKCAFVSGGMGTEGLPCVTYYIYTQSNEIRRCSPVRHPSQIDG